MTPHFNPERNALTQIGAVAMAGKFNEYLTPQEKKMYIVMSDLATSNGWDSKISISHQFAKEVFVKMATRTYRVQIASDGKVNVSSWGLANDVQDTYDSVDTLPAWMQLKIATLMIFDPEQVNNEIKGVGRRISKGTFWLYPEEGEDDGFNARAQGQEPSA